MHAGTHFTDPGRMESWVNFSGKEGHPNIQTSTRPGIKPGTSGLGGKDLITAPTPTAAKQRKKTKKTTIKLNVPEGGGVLPRKRLLGMCRWMGSHFHNWTDYNGITFLVELLEWGRKFSGFLWIRKFL